MKRELQLAVDKLLIYGYIPDPVQYAAQADLLNMKKSAHARLPLRSRVHTHLPCLRIYGCHVECV